MLEAVGPHGRRNRMREICMREATVAVIGAGQAGLSAAYHLSRDGLVSALEPGGGSPDPTFVVFDADAQPGGAWTHRWDSLTMHTINAIFDLPGFPVPQVDPEESSRIAIPRYFAEYEAEMQFPILRPVKVTRVTRVDDDPAGKFLIETSDGPWLARAIINASGTWNNPVLPDIPGKETFLGRHLHTKDYVSLDEFRGQRVGIVGGGISAVQQLEEISRVAHTAWYTRREPVFNEGNFRPEFEGRETIRKVIADVEAGKPSQSVVSYTGLIWTPYARAAQARGALNRRPMFTQIEPYGVRECDGSFTSLDTILWATGFKASLSHLDPLNLRNEEGGIQVTGTQLTSDPRIHLIGFGPSQSTVGANRAGRQAVRALKRLL